MQQTLPILIGAKGEQRGLRIAARYGNEWNSWADPQTFRRRSGILDQRCEEIGRDPSDIARSTQALLHLSDDPDWLARRRAEDTGARPVMIGNADDVAEIVAEYDAAGVDELIIPDWTMGSYERRVETCDHFITQVAAPVPVRSPSRSTECRAAPGGLPGT